MLLVLCVFAILATTSAQNDSAAVESPIIELELKPDLMYVSALKDVQLAAEKLSDVLAMPVKPEVDDTQLHTLVVMGVVEAAAKGLNINSSLSPTEAYKKAANVFLPYVLKMPYDVARVLYVDLNVLKSALVPMFVLVKDLCEGADEKTCNQLVQLEVENDPELQKVSDLLGKAQALAFAYLDFNEQVQLAAEKLSGVGYALNNVGKLSSLSNKLAKVLKAAKNVPYAIPY